VLRSDGRQIACGSRWRPFAPRPRADGAGSGGVLLGRSSTQRLLKELQRLQRSPPAGIQGAGRCGAGPGRAALRAAVHAAARRGRGVPRRARASPWSTPCCRPPSASRAPSGRFDPGARLCLVHVRLPPRDVEPRVERGDASLSASSPSCTRSRTRSGRYGRALLRGAGSQQPLTPSTPKRYFQGVLSRYRCRRERSRRHFGSCSRRRPAHQCAASASPSDRELISPCMCRGTDEWVHLGVPAGLAALRRSDAAHAPQVPDEHRLCLQRLPGALHGRRSPRSRHEQILEHLGETRSRGWSPRATSSSPRARAAARTSS